MLLEIAANLPELPFEIAFNDRRVDLIEEGVDLAIRMGDLGDHAGLVARRLYRQRCAVCASPAYLDSRMPVSSMAGTGASGLGCCGIRTGRIRSNTPRGRLVLGHGEAMLDAALAVTG